MWTTLKFYSRDSCVVFDTSLLFAQLDNGCGWCAHFRAKVLKECYMEEMEEDELIEAVGKFSCLWEVSSRS